MAITVYYELSAPESFTDSDVVRALETARRRAISRQFGMVSPLNRLIDGSQLAYCIESPLQNDGFLQVAPSSGFWFRIQLSHSTESATIGLCRFPAHARAAGANFSSRLQKGWHFQGSCRTQNPGECEFQAFCKRHVNLLALLREIQTLGIETEVEDDGDYWETNDTTILESKFKADFENIRPLDPALADPSDGHPPERKPTFLRSVLTGRLLTVFAKRAK